MATGGAPGNFTNICEKNVNFKLNKKKIYIGTSKDFMTEEGDGENFCEVEYLDGYNPYNQTEDEEDELIDCGEDDMSSVSPQNNKDDSGESLQLYKSPEKDATVAKKPRQREDWTKISEFPNLEDAQKNFNALKAWSRYD